MDSRFHHAPTRMASATPPRTESHVPSPGLVARARLMAGTIRASLRTSAWTALVGRTVFVAVALVILAWIGRAAANTNARSPRATADGGAGADTPAAVASTMPARALATSSSPQADDPAKTADPAKTDDPAKTASAAQAVIELGGGPSRGRATPADPVYLNHASLDELRRLPGVGPKRAQAIVALRQRVGRFQRVEDLLRVKGVGRATLRKWRPVVRLDTPPPPSEDAGRP